MLPMSTKYSRIAVIAIAFLIVGPLGISYVHIKSEQAQSELRVSAATGNVPKLQELIATGVDVNGRLGTPGNSPLKRAISNGQVNAVDVLLRAGANPNDIDSDGETPLIVAAYYGNAAIIKQLIEAGANVNAREPRNSSTALFVAAWKGHRDVVELLLSKGAEANIIRKDGVSAVCSATTGGHHDLANMLIRSGASPGCNSGLKVPGTN